jgi:hypothetical protein
VLTLNNFLAIQNLILQLLRHELISLILACAFMQPVTPDTVMRSPTAWAAGAESSHHSFLFVLFSSLSTMALETITFVFFS